MSLRLRQAVAGRPTVRSRYNTCAGLLEGDPFIVCVLRASKAGLKLAKLTSAGIYIGLGHRST